jgi:hypothetical protein
MPAMPSMPTSEWSGEARVRLGFSMDPPRQARWTIFLRFFLALPLLIVVGGIGIAASFVAIAAWFCALITGRVPDDIQRFITNALRLYANVSAYAYLLTSRWPGISFNPKPHDQVTIDIDHVGLSRWAVFFRYPLMFPAAIVSGLLFYGSYPLLIVMWLWGTITSREPRSFHQALSLVLRYQIRYQAYASMMTPTQPFKGLFGDGRDVVTPSVASTSAPTPKNTGELKSALTNSWFVVQGTRVVLVLILVLSIPAYILPISVLSTGFDSFPFVNYWKTVFSRALISNIQQNVSDDMNQFLINAESCTTVHYMRCVANVAQQTDSQLTTQTALLGNNVIFPSTALNQAVRYETTIDTLKSDLAQLENSTSYEFDQVILFNSIPKAQSNSEIAYLALNAQLHK